MINFLLNNYQFIKYINVPVNGQFGFQRPGTFYMLSVIEMHALIMFYCIIVFCCVSGLLFEIWYRFRESVNKYPTKRIRDNWIIEWMFISVPYFIVFLILIPSWALLYASNETHDCDCTMKAIGYQWRWAYEVHNYPFWIKNGYDWRLFWCCVREGIKWRTTTISFLELNYENSLFANYKYGFVWYITHKKIVKYILISHIIKRDILNGNSGYLAYLQYKWESVTLPVEELCEGHYRLFEVSKAVFLPIHRWIRINITSADVIHSWAIPAFGTKVDGIPGKLNTGYLLILHEGLFYGQCSEFCGKEHYRMSIVVKAVDTRSILKNL
jgi:heme/copper-type cytochrome/quinol oxidase subunit 2